jgi:hypothetical protein
VPLVPPLSSLPVTFSLLVPDPNSSCCFFGRETIYALYSCIAKIKKKQSLKKKPGTAAVNTFTVYLERKWWCKENKGKLSLLAGNGGVKPCNEVVPQLAYSNMEIPSLVCLPCNGRLMVFYLLWWDSLGFYHCCLEWI